MLTRAKNIFVVGIKGVAMANLALILKKMGKHVSGSDLEEEFITDELLRQNSISYSIGFVPFVLPKNTDLVIYSAAHGGTNNPQVVEAKKRKIKVISQAEILDQIIQKFKIKIAVCGCHGKTTTSSLLSYLLVRLNLKPSYLVGAPQFNDFWGGDYQKSNYFIIEADEYAVNPPSDKTPKFHYLNPNYIIVTNIDFDHPDVYENIEEVKKSFSAFVKKKQVKKIIACYDDIDLQTVLNKVDKNKILTYGFSKEADLVLRTVETHCNASLQNFQVFFHGKNLGEFSLSIFGKHNILNAGAVILFSLMQEFNIQEIKKAVKNFKGAKRRFEQIAYFNNTYLFDDYAHHPAEIQATIQAVRTAFKKRRIIIIFQPHTYSRTKALKNQFAKTLSQADYSLILPIFASVRERALDFNISSKDIEQAVLNQKKDNVYSFSSRFELLERLKTILQEGDVIFTMGAGDVYALKDDIIEIIKSKIKSQN